MDLKSGYTSVIKINGKPILPPVITNETRLEIQQIRELARQVERKLMQRTAQGLLNHVNTTLGKVNGSALSYPSYIPHNNDNRPFPDTDLDSNMKRLKLEDKVDAHSFDNPLLTNPSTITISAQSANSYYDAPSAASPTESTNLFHYLNPNASLDTMDSVPTLRPDSYQPPEVLPDFSPHKMDFNFSPYTSYQALPFQCHSMPKLDNKTETEKYSPETPLKRRGSYTLDHPSPALVRARSEGMSMISSPEPDWTPVIDLSRFIPYAKGYLFRELLLSPKVRQLTDTIKETSALLGRMQHETPIKRGHAASTDIDLKERALNQLAGAKQDFFELIYGSSFSEKVQMLKLSRSVSRQNISPDVGTRSTTRKLSSATRKAIQRRHEQQQHQQESVKTKEHKIKLSTLESQRNTMSSSTNTTAPFSSVSPVSATSGTVLTSSQEPLKRTYVLDNRRPLCFTPDTKASKTATRLKPRPVPKRSPPRNNTPNLPSKQRAGRKFVGHSIRN